MHRARASIDVFHAVADPTRRAILDRLRGGGVAVGLRVTHTGFGDPAMQAPGTGEGWRRVPQGMAEHVASSMPNA